MKHSYRPPRPVTGVVLLDYMWMMVVAHRKHASRSPRPVTGTVKTMKRDKWVVVRDTTRGWEGTEFNVGFEGSQAMSVCPSGKCKHLTGTIEI
jgi:hypothetical protein